MIINETVNIKDLDDYFFKDVKAYINKTSVYIYIYIQINLQIYVYIYLYIICTLFYIIYIIYI